MVDDRVLQSFEMRRYTFEMRRFRNIKQKKCHLLMHSFVVSSSEKHKFEGTTFREVLVREAQVQKCYLCWCYIYIETLVSTVQVREAQ